MPPKFRIAPKLITLLIKAERKVAELKGKGAEFENPHILVRLYLKRDAVLSSKIEATLASLEDLNKHEAIGNIDYNDIHKLRLNEVINYVTAFESSLKMIKKSDQQINLNIIKMAHKILMTKVRGQDQHPDEFRTQQNLIVSTTGTRQKIIYMLPPPKKILILLGNLEKFIQTSDVQISPLIQCAIIHYQFEAIPPFLDVNEE